MADEVQTPLNDGELEIMQPVDTTEPARVPAVGDGGRFQTFKKPSVYAPYVQYNSIEAVSVYGSVEGISSIYVNSHQYVLPIPKPLTAGDVWHSKVKSVWDNKIIFDGSADEAWLELETTPNKYRYVLPLPLGFFADTSNNNAGSNNFPLLAQGQPGKGVRGFTITPYYGEFSIVVYSDGETLESFRSYLAANPMSVWYQSTNYDGTNGLTVSIADYQDAIYANNFVDIFTDDGELWVDGGDFVEVATNNIVLNGVTNDERAGEYGTPQVHTFP
jgi:hypothetical protein